MEEDGEALVNGTSNRYSVIVSGGMSGNGKDRTVVEGLKEFDTTMEDWDDDSEVPNSQRQIQDTINEEEDFVIEEFED